MIGVIDVGLSNLRSVTLALQRLGEPYRLVQDPKALEACSAFILPGVGHFDAAGRKLKEAGLIEPLKELLPTRPTLGICLGMQLLFEGSDEGGEGLGLIEGRVVKLVAPGLPLPHLGWNETRFSSPYSDLDDNYYFIHTYAAAPEDPESVLATTEYGGTVVAAVKKGPLVGVQFHPEKSGAAGRRLLSSFLKEARAWSSSQASIS